MKRTSTIIKQAVKFLDEKKAWNISIFDVRKKSDITDFFILATGNSSVHVNSLAENFKQEMLKKEIVPLRRETENKWVVMDYGFFILHIFTNDIREKYNFEEILK